MRPPALLSQRIVHVDLGYYLDRLAVDRVEMLDGSVRRVHHIDAVLAYAAELAHVIAFVREQRQKVLEMDLSDRWTGVGPSRSVVRQFRRARKHGGLWNSGGPEGDAVYPRS